MTVWMRSVAAAGLLMGLVSCLEVELEVRIEADGSGAQRLHLGMNDELIRSVQASALSLIHI